MPLTNVSSVNSNPPHIPEAQTFEINEFVVFNITELNNNNEITKLLFFRSESVITSKTAFDIFVPPKLLF